MIEIGLILAILTTLAYIVIVTHKYNARQFGICYRTLNKLVMAARYAGEDNETTVILVNAAIDTYNESLRGPSLYTKYLKMPPHEYENGKYDEIERDQTGRRSDSQGNLSTREEQD